MGFSQHKMGHVGFSHAANLLAPYLSVPTSNKDRCVALSFFFRRSQTSLNFAADSSYPWAICSAY